MAIKRVDVKGHCGVSVGVDLRSRGLGVNTGGAILDRSNDADPGEVDIG